MHTVPHAMRSSPPEIKVQCPASLPLQRINIAKMIHSCTRTTQMLSFLSNQLFLFSATAAFHFRGDANIDISQIIFSIDYRGIQRSLFLLFFGRNG